MKKRRAEITMLAALIVFAAAERPSIHFSKPTLYQVGDFRPQRIETVRDLGAVAVKLLVTWVR